MVPTISDKVKKPTVKELELMWGEAWIRLEHDHSSFADGYQCGLRDARPDILTVRTPRSCMEKYRASLKISKEGEK
jgi:hypothetical protein